MTYLRTESTLQSHKPDAVGLITLFMSIYNNDNTTGHSNHGQTASLVLVGIKFPRMRD